MSYKHEARRYLNDSKRKDKIIEKFEVEITKRPASPLFGEARSRILKAMDNSVTIDDAIKKWEQLKTENERMKKALRWWIDVNEGAPNKSEWANQALEG